ncbi:MAG: FAD-dependent oxidoreductase [Candidatus Marinimicrobia bacterium]|nr:FAD-dependent oxidoreductase [Candidatus Neomarinimicrobiota bacterium]
MQRIEQHPILTKKENLKQVRFYFNEQEFYGYEGEAVSSALIANGVKEFSIHKKNDSPKGIYCANGQCSHCTVIIDGVPQKSCITPLREDMSIQTLKHLPELPTDDHPFEHFEKKEFKCDVLVVGGGPSGLTAAVELAELGFSIIIVDDKEELGGKLLLQTHKFFGSIEDCYAGTRGIDIGHILEDKVRSFKNIRIFTGSSIVGIFKDQSAGVFVNQENYIIIHFEGIIVSSGARERSLIFPGNDLPGVYGAGAFQTMVNRDLVKSSDRIFIIGSGNVGLIAAYHALQAGIQAVGICDILDKPSGYKVHADKIRRMGVPVYLNHTILSAEGDRKVEKVTIAKVDENWNPVLETAKTFKVDTLLIAVGLSPVDEFYEMAQSFGFKVVKTGDAREIAEASSAMFGGRIAGLEMAQLLGKEVIIDESYHEKAEVLKSHPGKIYDLPETILTEKFQPIINCSQEIPCNPCTSVCPVQAIQLKENLGSIMDIPIYTEGCTGCGLCVAICPGLAIVLARQADENFAEVVIPYEFIPAFDIGDKIPLADATGNHIGDGVVLKIRTMKKFKTHLITVKVDLAIGNKVAGIVIQPPAVSVPLKEARFSYLPDNGIVCQCEKITVKEVLDYIEEHKVRDVNQLKPLRLGMGACGGNTCGVLLPRLFKMAGVEWSEVAKGTKRPLSVEVPMFAIINENEGK